MTELILQALYSGVLQGGSYAVIALGLALVFGAMKVINLAHGELVLLSAYIAYSVESGLGWNPIFSIPISLVVVCLTSMMVYFVVGRIKKDREINSLILTYQRNTVDLEGRCTFDRLHLDAGGNGCRPFLQHAKRGSVLRR
jgi:branched-chain amino acid transport system permease protein